MNNNFNSKKLIKSVFITVLLLYFISKTSDLNSKIILIPFGICGITMAGKQLALLWGSSRLALIFSKLFTIGFLLFWFGFLSVTAFLCVKDKNYSTLLFTLPFWIVGIYIAKRSLLNTQMNEKSRLQIPLGVIVSIILVLITLIAGIMILAQGIVVSDMKLAFVGGFFAFGAFTFVLAALAVKGCFEHCKVDVLGLYIGILFVAIGVGVIAMIYRQRFGLWIVIPVLMIGAGVVQIVKCIREKDA